MIAATENVDKRILLVEDHLINQKVAATMLARLGFSVVVANNGQEALDAITLDNESYSVILMDCQMPVLDGYDCTRAIRKHQSLSGEHTPIVALTAFAMPGDREKCIAAGMDDFIAKPVSLDVLRDTIQKYVEPQATLPEPPLTDGIDFSTFDEIRDILGADFGPLINTFFDDSIEHLALVKIAVDVGNTRATASSSHILKGSSDSIGARHLAHLCGELETAALEDHMDPAPNLIVEIDAEMARVWRFLTPFKAS